MSESEAPIDDTRCHKAILVHLYSNDWWPLERTKFTTVGDDPKCDVCLRGSYPLQHERHALIRPVDGGAADFSLDDLPSRWPIHVNGQSLEGTQGYRLQAEDRVTIGNDRLKFVVVRTHARLHTYAVCSYSPKQGEVPERKRKRKRKLSAEDSRRRADQVLRRLWSGRKFPDVVFVCEGKRFELHRAVLADASPVFQTMLSSGMKEGLDRVVHIKGHTPSAVEAMFEYVYTGELTTEHDPAELLGLADKYEFPSLAEQCAEAVLDSLTQDNIVSAIRAVKPYGDRPHVEPFWTKMCNTYRRMLMQYDSVFQGCIDAM